MSVETEDSVETALAARRVELEAMPLPDIRRNFESTFGIQPNLRDGKSDLIERVLAKQRAQLRRLA